MGSRPSGCGCPEKPDALFAHLKGGSNMIQARHIGLIAHELETIYEKLINQQIQVTPQLIALIRLVQDDIADRIPNHS